MTWLHADLEISPFLNITSATKRCGKTLLMDVIGVFVHRPMPTNNVTAAALFRIIESRAPTLLLDEADRTFANHWRSRSAFNASQLPNRGIGTKKLRRA